MLAMRHWLPIIVGLAVNLVAVGTEGVAQTSCMLPESFDDPHGRKGLAIEYLGNGMTISRDGEDIPFEPDESDNSQWLEAYKKILRNGWEAPRGYSLDIYGFATDDAGRVCVTKQGRLISSTSLVLNPQARKCDPKRYIDATKFPGIVVPNREDEDRAIEGADREVAPAFAERGVRRGDLAVVYNPETKIWK